MSAVPDVFPAVKVNCQPDSRRDGAEQRRNVTMPCAGDCFGAVFESPERENVRSFCGR